MGVLKSPKRGNFQKNEEKWKIKQQRGIEPWSPAWQAGIIAIQPWGSLEIRVNVNILFLHTNPKKIFNLQSTYTFSAKYENFLSLALSQAMCTVCSLFLHSFIDYVSAQNLIRYFCFYLFYIWFPSIHSELFGLFMFGNRKFENLPISILLSIILLFIPYIFIIQSEKNYRLCKTLKKIVLKSGENCFFATFSIFSLVSQGTNLVKTHIVATFCRKY